MTAWLHEVFLLMARRGSGRGITMPRLRKVAGHGNVIAPYPAEPRGATHTLSNASSVCSARMW